MRRRATNPAVSRPSVRSQKDSLRRSSAYDRPLMDTSKSLQTHYNLLEELGRGRFGRRVIVAEDTAAGARIALRVFSRAQVSKADFLREYNCSLFLAPHPNVVETYEGAHESSSSWWFVQEYAPCGSLRTLLETHSGAIPESLTHYFLEQAMSGLSFVHEEGLVYRELRAENMLLFPPVFCGSVPEHSGPLDTLRLKLADFRLTRVTPPYMLLKQKAGTRVTLEHETLTPYHPPELCDLLQKEAFMAEQSADIWALGILVFLLTRGRFPWPRATITNQAYYDWREWRKGNTHVPPKLFQRFSERGLKMMKKALAVKAKDRPSVKDVTKYLKDRWLRETKSMSEDDLRGGWRRHRQPLPRSMPASPTEPELPPNHQRQRKSIIHQWFATTLSAMSEISEQMVSAED